MLSLPIVLHPAARTTLLRDPLSPCSCFVTCSQCMGGVDNPFQHGTFSHWHPYFFPQCPENVPGIREFHRKGSYVC